MKYLLSITIKCSHLLLFYLFLLPLLVMIGSLLGLYSNYILIIIFQSGYVYRLFFIFIDFEILIIHYHKKQSITLFFFVLLPLPVMIGLLLSLFSKYIFIIIFQSGYVYRFFFIIMISKWHYQNFHFIILKAN